MSNMFERPPALVPGPLGTLQGHCRFTDDMQVASKPAFCSQVFWNQLLRMTLVSPLPSLAGSPGWRLSFACPLFPPVLQPRLSAPVCSLAFPPLRGPLEPCTHGPELGRVPTCLLPRTHSLGLGCSRTSVCLRIRSVQFLVLSARARRFSK